MQKTDVTQTQEEAAKQRQAEEAYVNALMGGKAPAPNSIIAYIVEELKHTQNETRAVAKTLRQAEEVTAQARQRLAELKGVGQKYFEDIITNKDKKDGSNGSDEKLVVPAKVVPSKRINKV
jgi:predicted nucleic acid-binding OB-fold protein